MYTGLLDSPFFDSLVFIILCFRFFALKTFLLVMLDLRRGQGH